MSAPSLEVLAIQLRQIQSQLEVFLDGGSQSVWQMKDAPVAFLATIQTRLDDARHAVNMARLRAEQELKAVEGPLPVCANDSKLGKCPVCDGTGADPLSDNGNNSLPCRECQGTGKHCDYPLAAKRDPKPDSGDDPRWQGPEYDKYEHEDFTEGDR